MAISVDMITRPLQVSRGGTVHLRPWKVVAIIALTVLGFVIVDVIGYATVGPATFRNTASLSKIDFRLEGNVTTFFSALVLLGAAAACLINAYWCPQPQEMGIRRLLPGWRLLALIFIFLAIDEAAQFHEQLSRFGPHLGGSLAFANERSWVIFYGAFALSVGGAFVPFLLRLRARAAVLIILAGAIYVFSAAGLEEVGAWLRTSIGRGPDDMVVAMCALAEESGEVLGISLLIGAALSYARQEGARLTLAFA